MGKFRTTKLQLKAKKKVEGDQSNPVSQDYSNEKDHRLRIDPDYVQDFSLLKEKLIASCNKVANMDSAKKLTEKNGLRKNEIKNMLIGFSNVLLRKYN